MNERWIGTMNERWTIEWSNERSEFRQHNSRKKIIWTNERTNDRMIERTNDRNFGSITAGQRLSGRTMNRNYERTMNDRMIERMNDRNFGSITVEKRLFGRTNRRTIEQSDERTNEPWTIGRTNEQTKNRGWTIEERSNDPCASVCLCGTWSGCVCGGRELPWNGLGWDERRPLPLYL
jgi:hypothetical protein